MLSAGVVIAGKYRVLQKLGEGAMGSVWLAKNEVTNREFALKVLLPQAASAPTALARFFQEARVCGALRHPSILEIYDAGTADELDGAPYLVMERLEGAPLDLVLRRRGALGPRLALDILAEISRGLHLAHLKGIVHRDLKPANIFLHRPGTGAIEPKVLDFGISKMVDRASPAIALTQSATILGSPLYMSPEQMDPGRVLDARSDVHALGVLLWECLTGEAPFAATSYNNLVVEIMKGPRPRLRDAMPAATEGMARIVERAFAIDVAERFASAAALADAVDAELGILGGGVLLLRTAAAEVLTGLDVKTAPPPPMQGSTFEAMSVDKGRAVSTHTARLPSQPSAKAPSHHSFAETELSAGGDSSVPRHPAAAVSASAPSGSREAPQGGRKKLLFGAAAAVLIAVGAAVVLTAHQAPAPAAAAAALPSAPSPPSASPPSPVPFPAKNELVVLATPPEIAATASASAVALGPSVPATSSKPQTHAMPSPKRPAAAVPVQAPPVARPRIDQSGL